MKQYNVQFNSSEAVWLLTLLTLTKDYVPKEQTEMAEHMLNKLSTAFIGEETTPPEINNSYN